MPFSVSRPGVTRRGFLPFAPLIARTSSLTLAGAERVNAIVVRLAKRRGFRVRAERRGDAGAGGAVRLWVGPGEPELVDPPEPELPEPPESAPPPGVSCFPGVPPPPGVSP